MLAYGKNFHSITGFTANFVPFVIFVVSLRFWYIIANVFMDKGPHKEKIICEIHHQTLEVAPSLYNCYTSHEEERLGNDSCE